MKRRMIAMIVAIGLIAMITCQVFATSTIKVGYWHDEPNVIANANATLDKHPKGAVVDYWEKYIAPGMGVNIEWVGPLSMDRLQVSLEEGSIDAVAFLAKTPERAKKFLYPADGFADIQSGLAVLKTNPLNKIEKVEDISNLKIGYVTGALVTPFMKDSAIKWELLASANHVSVNMLKLVNGRVDAVYSPSLIPLKHVLGKSPNAAKFKYLALPEKSVEAYSVFSKKANPEFFKNYEAVNAKAKANFSSLLKKYVSE